MYIDSYVLDWKSPQAISWENLVAISQLSKLGIALCIKLNWNIFLQGGC
jgi:hypothetical protein